jgi:hypothetical protein
MPRQPGDFLAFIYNCSFIRLKELEDSSTCSGLAAPAFPHQAECTTVANIKVHPVDRLDPSDDSLKKAPLDRKVLLEPFDSEQVVVG